ncbi:hypothetical protein SAMN05444339_109107 [Loktanella atrilutea]|uniref:Uncharacterized protein n=1 Tax=Loktanella atrilutea TaxID=366533 RepID=A0A1M5DBP7_LOKAT|nr:hypothetical protein [Loktanella atrilutea]SHF64112.1 hypothetical protein SAMN05444339_109107 [Loktanella atrilutea]
MTEGPRLTAAQFDAALAARGIAPDAADRDAALTIARFLDDCTRRLKAEAPDDTPDHDAGE